MTNTKKLNGKITAFCHRDEPTHEYGRGYQGKCALYTRIYLVGTGDFAEARRIRPPKGDQHLRNHLTNVQSITH